MTEKPKLDKNEMAKKPKWSECEPTTEKKTLPLCRPPKKNSFIQILSKKLSRWRKKKCFSNEKTS